MTMNLDDLRATKAVADLDLLPEDRLAVAAMVAAGYAHARKVKGGEPERITDTDRMDALGLPGWELSMNDAVECNAWELWHVHVCSGGRNDREWTLIGAGATPREAIDAAIASTDSHTLPTNTP